MITAILVAVLAFSLGQHVIGWVSVAWAGILFISNIFKVIDVYQATSKE